jgi:Gas vesicle synthesis protein GvpL/GvpF
VIHLYAFVQGLRELDSRFEARPFGSVAAVTGAEEPNPVSFGLVVESLLDKADAVLPVRFGERFADEEDLAAAVAPRLPAIERQLGHVGGCVEVGVRIVPRSDPEARADGAAYMQARLHEHRAVEEIHQALAAEARDSVRTSADAGYLVERGDVHNFSLAVERLLESHSALDVVCTGPWAPYSFAAAT